MDAKFVYIYNFSLRDFNVRKAGKWETLLLFAVGLIKFYQFQVACEVR